MYIAYDFEGKFVLDFCLWTGVFFWAHCKFSYCLWLYEPLTEAF